MVEEEAEKEVLAITITNHSVNYVASSDILWQGFNVHFQGVTAQPSQMSANLTTVVQWNDEVDVQSIWQVRFCGTTVVQWNLTLMYECLVEMVSSLIWWFSIIYISWASSSNMVLCDHGSIFVFVYVQVSFLKLWLRCSIFEVCLLYIYIYIITFDSLHVECSLYVFHFWYGDLYCNSVLYQYDLLH